MDYGDLSRYFSGVGAKLLSQVDVNPTSSNQHEINAGRMRKVFGDARIDNIPTTFAYLSDDDSPIFDRGFTTWYDCRAKNPNRRPEYRLYYNDNESINRARQGDLTIIGLTEDAEALILFAPSESIIGSQLRWLFGIEGIGESGLRPVSSANVRVTSIAADILELVGIKISIPQSAENYLDAMIQRFGESFPKGSDFTDFCISTIDDLDWLNEPDAGLVACYNREEMLFRVFERHLLERDLAPLMKDPLDVDGVLKTTMSTFQRRKSRAGTAFENHLARLFEAQDISFSAQCYTEGKSKPDFIFPCINAYKNPAFPTTRLTMLGAKTTIKERWRQVLDEANRIEEKHLVTLEPAVSEDYTRAMREDKLQLVVPKGIFSTYTAKQQTWLMSVEQFCDMVKSRQKADV